MNAAAILERWSKLDHQARRALIGGVVLVACAIAAALFFSRDDRVALFSRSLSSEQLSEVDRQLSEWYVPFALGTDNVRVPRSQRSELLLRLSLVGVPHDHISGSQEALDKITAMTPQSVLEAQTREGLAGDLELGLRGIDGVESARVIIAPAKPAFFADETPTQASASVRLVVAPGASLAAQTIDGIRGFVAAGVPGLDAARVQIVDDRGVSLGDAAARTPDSMNVQSSIQAALDRVVGYDRTLVRVTTEYDNDQRSSHEVRRAPILPVAIREVTSSENYRSGEKSYSRARTTSDKGAVSTDTQTNAAPGRIRRRTVAVMIDQGLLGERSEIERFVAAAAGIDPHRGDAISVTTMDFPRARNLVADPPKTWLALVLPLIPLVLVLAAIVLVVMLVANALRSSLAHRAERDALEQARRANAGADPARIRKSLEGEPPHAAAAYIAALPGSVAIGVLNQYGERERREIVERLGRVQSPLVVAARPEPNDA